MRNLKQKLENNEKIYGMMVTEFYTPNIAKMLSQCGFDFFIIDCEHGYFDNSQVANLLAVANATGIPVLIRIPEVSRIWILKYIEMGANGLLVPMTESGEEIENAIKFAKYAPIGSRGVSLSRPHTEYKKVNARDYMNQVNQDMLIIAQIESEKGIDNITEILEVDGLDAVLLGPNDLSQDMKMLGDLYNQSIINGIEKVIKTAQSYNKYCGIHSSKLDYVEYWKQRGMTILMWNSDIGMMMSKGMEGLSELKNKEV